MCVCPPQECEHEQADVLVYRGYLCLEGPRVNAAAARSLPAGLLPPHFKDARQKRDGPAHHITLMNALECSVRPAPHCRDFRP